VIYPMKNCLLVELVAACSGIYSETGLIPQGD
jgi:hypothetical protein